MQLSTLQLVTRTFYDVQDVRKKAENRVYSMKRDLVLPFLDTKVDKMNKDFVVDKYNELKPSLPMDKIVEVQLVETEVFGRNYSTENALAKLIVDDITQQPLYTEWIKYVYNVDCILTAALISEIMDIGRFSTISKLWQYAGYGVMNIVKDNGIVKLWYPTQQEAIGFMTHATDLEQATAEKWGRDYDNESKMSEYLSRCIWGLRYNYQVVASKRLSGLPYLCNADLKVAGWKIAQQFQRSSPDKSKYRQYYDHQKEYYTKKFEGERDKGHINNMTLRKATKLFLSHVWTQWRKLEGLPLSKPYCIEHLDHQDYIEPFYDKEIE